MKCFICKEAGHRAANCPKNKNKTNIRNIDTDNEEDESPIAKIFALISSLDNDDKADFRAICANSDESF